MSKSITMYELLPSDLDFNKRDSNSFAKIKEIEIKEIQVEISYQNSFGRAAIVYKDTHNAIEGNPFLSLEDAREAVTKLIENKVKEVDEQTEILELVKKRVSV